MGTYGIELSTLTPPRSRDVGGSDAKTGPEFGENFRWQPFRHDVGELLSSGDVKNTELAERHPLADEEDIQLDVLCSAMVNRVGGQVDSGDVVTVNQRGLVDGGKQLAE